MCLHKNIKQVILCKEVSEMQLTFEIAKELNREMVTDGGGVNMTSSIAFEWVIDEDFHSNRIRRELQGRNT